MVSKDRRVWTTNEIGIFHFVASFYILPLSYFLGKYSKKLDARKILLVALFSMVVGILLGFDYIDFYETSIF